MGGCGINQLKPLSLFSHRWINCARPVRALRLTQMPVCWAALATLGCWTHKSTLFFPMGKLRAGIFHLFFIFQPFALCWIELRSTSPTQHRYLYPVTRFYWTCQNSTTGKTEVSIQASSGNLRYRMGKPSPSLPWVKLVARGSLTDHMVLYHIPGVWWEGSHIFLWVLVGLALHSPWVQKTFTQFLDFSQREFSMNCWSVCWWWGKGPGKPTLASCWHPIYIYLILLYIFPQVTEALFFQPFSPCASFFQVCFQVHWIFPSSVFNLQ